MILPTAPQIWRSFAQGCAGVSEEFAMVANARHCFNAGLRPNRCSLRSLRCYPSPSLRSGPSQAGPILMCDPCNRVRARSVKNRFQICDIAVESHAITTDSRGSTKCRSRLSSSLYSPCRWPVACRTPHRAVWLARLRARWSPMLWMKTCWQAPRLVVWPVLPPVASSLVCRPATAATDRLIDLAAFGRVHLTPRTIRADRPGGLFAFRLGGADV